MVENKQYGKGLKDITSHPRTNKIVPLLHILFLVLIFSQSIPETRANFRSSTINAKEPEYISNFVILEKEGILECRFSLLDKDHEYTAADGSVNIKIYDKREILLYDNTHIIKKEDFGWYTLVLTGADFMAYVWEIPFSSIKKGISPGSANLTFTSEGWVWEIEEDWVTIPEYTEEELAELYEEKYLPSRIIIDETITKTPFKITLLSVGKYTYMPYTWGDEETYFRIDLNVRNIGTEKEYLFTSDIIIIDNLWNQYDSEYYGTLESGELYPGVIRTGSVLFPVLNKEADSIRIIITKSEYPEDIVYEFTLDISEMITKETSIITCSISTNTITQGESIIVTGSINPYLSAAPVTLTFSRPDGSTITRPVTTSSNGAYRDSYNPTQIGSWGIKASWEGNAIYSGATSQTIEFTVVEPPPTGSLKIIIQDENENPIRGATLSSTSQPNGQQAISGASSTDGSVVFSDVKIGNYAIQASKSGFETNSKTVTVIEGETTTQIIQLKEQVGTLKILVKDKESKPVSGATVTSTSQPNGRSSLSDTTGSDGSVTFTDVKIGAYTFQATKSGYISETGSVTAKTDETTTLTINIEKIELFGTLKITIEDVKNNPLSGVMVSSTSQPSGQSSLSGTTGSDGSIAFGDVKLGSYTFEVSRSGYIAKSGTINAKPGETSELTITLEKEEKGGGGIPGFPYESILLGLALGVLILWIFQRRQ